MYFVRPEWLRHGVSQHSNADTAIFSLDMSEKRLATAGQDCRIKIWKLDVLRQGAKDQKGKGKDKSKGSGQGEGEKDKANEKDGEKSATDPPENALLALLNDHAGAVNCVRWSPDGALLASGGDDGVVLVYEQSTGLGMSTFGATSSSSLPKENWRCRRPLRGHNGDVTDIAWSADGTKLASAGVDNSVIIWNVPKQGPPSQLQRLEGHRGLVKGVCWDPVGKYLASQSDDRTIIVWRTSDWKKETQVSGPLKNAVLHENNMTFFLRLSWSPCGSVLVGVNGFKKPFVHVASMFFREHAFNESVEFVGHTEPVICSRFSPRLYTRQKIEKKPSGQGNLLGNEGQSNHSMTGGLGALAGANDSQAAATTELPVSKSNAAYIVVGLGSKDHGCSIWKAGDVRPFYCMQEMFDGDVSDLAWSPDGYSLAACSADGRVMYMEFDPKELGYVMDNDDQQNVLSELWKSYFGGVQTGEPLPESVDQLRLEAQSKTAFQAALPKSTRLPLFHLMGNRKEASKADGLVTKVEPPTNPVNGTSRKAQDDELKKTGLGDGSESQDVSSGGGALTSRGAPTPTPTSVATTEDREKLQASAPMDTEPAPGTPMIAPASATAAPVRMLPVISRSSQREVRVSGGKRRIIPAMIGDPNGEDDGTAVGSSIQQPTGFGANLLNSADPSGFDNMQADGTASKKWRTDTGVKTRSNANGQAGSDAQAAFALTVPTFQLPLQPIQPMLIPPMTAFSLMPSNSSLEKEQSNALVRSIGPDVKIEIRNATGSSRVSCYKESKLLWKFHVGGAGACMTTGLEGHFVAVGTLDGYLHLLSASSGRQLLPPLALESSPYLMETCAYDPPPAALMNLGSMDQLNAVKNRLLYLLVITRSGLCSVYEMKSMRLVSARSAAPLLLNRRGMEPSSQQPNADGSSPTPQIEYFRSVVSATVTLSGEPIVTMSDGYAFVFHRDMQSWMRIADDSYPSSEFFRPTVVGGDDPNRVVGRHQAFAASSARLLGTVPRLPMREARKTFLETIGHLENLLQSSVIVDSPAEYRYYLACYASKLGMAPVEDMSWIEPRIRELCDDLGSLPASLTESVCPSRIGLNKAQLLEQIVLPILGANRRFQRLTSEYMEILRMRQGKSAADAAAVDKEMPKAQEQEEVIAIINEL